MIDTLLSILRHVYIMIVQIIKKIKKVLKQTGEAQYVLNHGKKK